MRLVSRAAKEDLKTALDRLDCSRQVDFSTYAALIRQCGRDTNLSQGKRLHSHLVQAGYDSKPFLANLLVQMYGKCGQLEEATDLFSTIPTRNVVTWNIILAAHAQAGHLELMYEFFSRMPSRDLVTWNTILAAHGQHGILKDAKDFFNAMPEWNTVSWNSLSSAYARRGHYSESLRCFTAMDLEGIPPDPASFVIALDASSALQALAQGVELHQLVVESELITDVAVRNSLVAMYGRCGALEHAKTCFDTMLSKDFTSWTVMTRAYARGGYMEDARLVFERTPSLGVISWNIMVNSYGQRGDVEDAKLMFDMIPERSIVSENSMLLAYTQNGYVKDARGLFDGMVCADMVSWTTLIGAHSGTEAVKLFMKMIQDGLKPNRVTFISVLDACHCPRQVKHVHNLIAESGFQLDDSLSNSLIHTYGKVGELELARLVFEAMSSTRSLVSWNSIISAYAEHGRAEEANSLLQSMHLQGHLPNEITFIAMVDGSKTLEAGKLLHELVADTVYCSFPIVATVLVNFYGKFGRLEEAKLVFEGARERNIVVYTSMVSAYARNGLGLQAFQEFKTMDIDGFTPNQITFISVLDGLASATAGVEGRLVHTEVIQSGYESDTTVTNSLINMYTKCGDLNRAAQLFNRMESDVVSWNVMILGYAQNGDTEQAFNTQLRMNLEGVMPNELTFVSLLSACTHAGVVRDSMMRFSSISGDYGLIPTEDHFLCMVGILGRAGRLQEAEELIRAMPYEPDFVAWTSLLGACRVGGDVTRAEHAALSGQSLQPEVDVLYVLLTNSFAGAGAGAGA